MCPLVRLAAVLGSKAIDISNDLGNPGNAWLPMQLDAIMSTLRSADRRNYAVTKFRNIPHLLASFDFQILRSPKRRKTVAFKR